MKRILSALLILALLFTLCACGKDINTDELTNAEKYKYSVAATFYVDFNGGSIGEAVITTPVLEKSMEEYCNDFTLSLEDAKVLSILRKYGFSSCHNIEICSIDETEMFSVIFYSNEKETIAEMATKVCEVLPEVIEKEYRFDIKIVDIPTISKIKENKI